MIMNGRITHKIMLSEVDQTHGKGETKEAAGAGESTSGDKAERIDKF